MLEFDSYANSISPGFPGIPGIDAKAIDVNTSGHTAVLACMCHYRKLPLVVLLKSEILPNDKFPSRSDIAVHVQQNGWIDERGCLRGCRKCCGNNEFTVCLTNRPSCYVPVRLRSENISYLVIE